MPELIAKRTLVKSPPELWEELSEVERLAKHLGAFGEITITKLEPEHTVAWEGEHASGTVSIEPSGWGTKVTLQAELPGAEVPQPEDPVEAPQPPEPVEPQPVEPDPADPEPVAEEPEPRRRGFWAWLFRPRRADRTEHEPEPVAPEPEPVLVEPVPEPIAIEPEPQPAEPEAGPDGLDPERARLVLDEALDALGAAHHRPFSRG